MNIDLEHLEHDNLYYRIVYREQHNSVVGIDIYNGEKNIYAKTWTRWWLYTRNMGAAVYRDGEPLWNPLNRLKALIARLKKRHPSREYKIVVVHSTQKVTEVES